LTKTAAEGHIANDIREKNDLDINDYQLLDLDISNGIEAETVISEENYMSMLITYLQQLIQLIHHYGHLQISSMQKNIFIFNF
jgi:hypothetical protein